MKSSRWHVCVFESFAGATICSAPGCSSTGGAATGEGRRARSGSLSVGFGAIVGVWEEEKTLLVCRVHLG